ncbi:MAG: hypothetical protein ACTSYB_01530 [Candidatus Helarchaeota archaeon]
MWWLILLFGIILVGIVWYRFYANPPLSQMAKLQKERYIHNFQHSKTLVYKISQRKEDKLKNKLRKLYRDAGFGCYYGRGIMFYVYRKATQVSILLFSSAEDMLMRHTWKLVQIMKSIGEG